MIEIIAPYVLIAGAIYGIWIGLGELKKIRDKRRGSNE